MFGLSNSTPAKYRPSADEHLFQDHSNELGRWMTQFEIDENLAEAVTRLGAQALLPVAQKLVTSARRNRQWERWREHRTDASLFTRRILTPLFAIPAVDNHPRNRLILVSGGPLSTQSIARVERVLLTDVYSGPELVWNPRDITEPALFSLEFRDGISRPISEDGETRPLWLTGVKAILAADLKFNQTAIN